MIDEFPLEIVIYPSLWHKRVYERFNVGHRGGHGRTRSKPGCARRVCGPIRRIWRFEVMPLVACFHRHPHQTSPLNNGDDDGDGRTG